ncbi:TonB-dependent receptor plug domain-containing protein [Pseudoxanthomonas daejeonensis]|nr:TonB-dependent receptor [Pseudoxanthomonas daejeonensis]
MLPLAIAIALLCATPLASAQSTQAQSAPVQATSAPAPAPSVPATPANATATTDLDSVSVQGERYDARRDDTATRIVIAREELLRQGDTTLGEALKRLPGVTIGSGTPGRSGAVALRGMAGYTQVLIDGQRAPTGFDFDSLTPDMVERIEILRSPTADLSGESIAGTINIVLAQTARTDARQLTLAWATADGRQAPSASWRSSRREESRSHVLTATAARREFLYEDTGLERGYDPAGVENLRRTTRLRSIGVRDGLTLAPTLDLRLANDDTLALQAFLDSSHLKRTGDVDWETLLGPQLDHVRYRQGNDIDNTQFNASVAWTHPFAAAGTLTAKANAAWNREDYLFREQGYAADGSLNLEDHTTADMDVHNLGSSGKWSLPQAGRHQVQAGWDAGVDRRRETRVQHLFPVAGNQEWISDLSFDAQIRRLAAYAQDDITFSPQWSMYLGLRWETIETTSDGSGLAAVRNRASVLSPVMQSLWKMPGSDKDQVRLALSRTFKAPTLAALSARPYTSTNNRPLNPDVRGNPGLEPELATGLDAAYERYGKDGARLSVGGYVRRIRGVIRTETRMLEGRWVAFPANGGDASAWGLEMDARAGLAQLHAGAPAIDLRFNATLNRSRVDGVPGPDNRIDQQVPFSATLGADWKFDPEWTAGLGYTYRSGGPVRITASRGNLDAYRRELDMYLLWAPARRAKLRLAVTNALYPTLETGQWYLDADGLQRIDRQRRPPVGVRLQWEMQL